MIMKSFLEKFLLNVWFNWIKWSNTPMIQWLSKWAKINGVNVKMKFKTNINLLLESSQVRFKIQSNQWLLVKNFFNWMLMNKSSWTVNQLLEMEKKFFTLRKNSANGLVKFKLFWMMTLTIRKSQLMQDLK